MVYPALSYVQRASEFNVLRRPIDRLDIDITRRRTIFQTLLFRVIKPDKRDLRDRTAGKRGIRASRSFRDKFAEKRKISRQRIEIYIVLVRINIFDENTFSSYAQNYSEKCVVREYLPPAADNN